MVGVVMNDILSWAVKFFDLGLTGALVGGMLYGFLSLVPKVLSARAHDQTAQREMQSKVIEIGFSAFREFGDRIARAQEKQAEAVGRLSEHMARHDGLTSETMDALQMSIASVDQRVALVEGHLQTIANSISPLSDFDRKLDALLGKAGS